MGMELRKIENHCEQYSVGTHGHWLIAYEGTEQEIFIKINIRDKLWDFV